MTAFIDTNLTPLVAFLLEWSLRWLLVAALPILWLRLRPPYDARLRYQICLATLAAGLLLPVIPRWGGLVPIQPTPPTEQAETFEAAPPTQISAAPVALPPQIPPEPAAAIPNEVVRPSEPVVLRDTPVSELIDWRPILIRGVTLATTMAWLAGVLILLTRWIAGSVYLHQLRRTAFDVDAATTELLAACKRDLQVSRHVRIVFHYQVASPLLMGLGNPTILLPSSWAQLSPSLQRASLLHELAHVVRRDDWIALALRLTDLALFFHPCYRWLRNSLEREREICCDDLALASGVEPSSYAQMLRDFASLHARLRLDSSSIPFGQPSTVKSRIRHILEVNMLPRTSKTRWIWIASALVLMLSAAIGSLHLYAAIPSEPQVEKAQIKTRKNGDELVRPVLVKEELTFGGKGFEEWQFVWRTDLKPDVRIEAFQALGTFGKNGYDKEAAPAIIELVSTYDPTTSDQFDKKVYLSALDEINRLGGRALPALESELKNGKLNARRFAAIALNNMLKNAKPVEKGLLEALNDQDFLVRQQAALSLENFAPSNHSKRLDMLVKIVESNLPQQVTLYQRVGGTDSLQAIQALILKGKDARPIVGRLVRLLGKLKGGYDSSLANAITAIGGEPHDLVHLLVYRLENPVLGTDQEKILKSLREEYREAAKAVVPDLIAQCKKTPNLPEKAEIVNTLISLEAEPKDVVPLIKDLIKAWPDNVVMTGYSKIDLEPKFKAYLKKHASESAKPPSGKSSMTLDSRVWSVPGTLGATTFRDSSGQKFYRLTPDNLQANGIVYCVAEPRFNLDPFLNRRVQLYGEWGYHKDMKQNFMKVSEVNRDLDQAASSSK